MRGCYIKDKHAPSEKTMPEKKVDPLETGEFILEEDDLPILPHITTAELVTHQLITKSQVDLKHPDTIRIVREVQTGFEKWIPKKTRTHITHVSKPSPHRVGWEEFRGHVAVGHVSQSGIITTDSPHRKLFFVSGVLDTLAIGRTPPETVSDVHQTILGTKQGGLVKGMLQIGHWHLVLNPQEVLIPYTNSSSYMEELTALACAYFLSFKGKVNAELLLDFIQTAIYSHLGFIPSMAAMKEGLSQGVFDQCMAFFLISGVDMEWGKLSPEEITKHIDQEKRLVCLTKINLPEKKK